MLNLKTKPIFASYLLFSDIVCGCDILDIQTHFDSVDHQKLLVFLEQIMIPTRPRLVSSLSTFYQLHQKPFAGRYATVLFRFSHASFRDKETHEQISRLRLL